MPPDYVVCLQDGKKMKMLKRYLSSTHDIGTVSRELPADYPMVAPSYAKKRFVETDFQNEIIELALAHTIGNRVEQACRAQEAVRAHGPLATVL